MSEIGHNSGEVTEPQTLTNASQEAIRNIVARVENLTEQKDEIAQEIREVFAEAKAFGLDAKALRAVIRLRKQDRNDRAEMEMTIALYEEALGDLL